MLLAEAVRDAVTVHGAAACARAARQASKTGCERSSDIASDDQPRKAHWGCFISDLDLLSTPASLSLCLCLCFPCDDDPSDACDHKSCWYTGSRADTSSVRLM